MDGPRESGQRSPQFLQVVDKLGELLGLQPDKIAAGAAIAYSGVNFWIGHDGAMDPDGLVLYIHMGTIAPESELFMFRQMLEKNAEAPSAVSGFFSLLPGTSDAAFCVRMNLAKATNAAEGVLACVGLLARQVDELDGVLAQALALAREQAAGMAASA